MHIDTLLTERPPNYSASKKEDPVERFVDVLRYYLSGWHIKPKGVKKP